MLVGVYVVDVGVIIYKIMNKELLKQLKEAGYPLQKATTGYAHKDLAHKLVTIDDYVYIIPELSELIEACGKEHKAPNRNTENQYPIEHLFRLGYGDEWYATYEFYDSKIEDKYGIPLIGWGKDPEEAVAKLWLMLKEENVV